MVEDKYDICVKEYLEISVEYEKATVSSVLCVDVSKHRKLMWHWDEGKLHRHLTSVSFLGQTL